MFVTPTSLLAIPSPDAESPGADAAPGIAQPTFVCPECGAAMIVVEILDARATDPRATAASGCAMSGRLGLALE